MLLIKYCTDMLKELSKLSFDALSFMIDYMPIYFPESHIEVFIFIVVNCFRPI